MHVWSVNVVDECIVTAAAESAAVTVLDDVWRHRLTAAWSQWSVNTTVWPVRHWPGHGSLVRRRSTARSWNWPRRAQYSTWSWPRHSGYESFVCCFISDTCNWNLEGTHWVRTHALLLLILTLTLTCDLSTQNHVTCRISLYQVWTLWDHSFSN